MKVKKVLNQRSDPKVVQMTDLHKSNDSTDLLVPLSPEVPKQSVSCTQSSPMDTTSVNHHNDTIEGTRSTAEDLMKAMPELKALPHFYQIEWRGDDMSLPPLPPLKPLPDLSYESYSETNYSNISTNYTFENQLSNECIDVFTQSDEQLVSDLDQLLRQFPQILDTIDVNLTPTVAVNESSFVPNPSVDSVITQNYSSNLMTTEVNATNNVSNDTNSDHNFVDKTQSSVVCRAVSKQNESMSESVVSIDLSDTSNSPKSVKESTNCSNVVTTHESPIPSISSLQRSTTFTFTKTKAIDNRLSNGISNELTAQKLIRSPLKVKSMVPYNYCAKDYRIFNMTRHSARHKTSTHNEEFDYDLLSNASWDQIDGSKYECKVNKWSDEDMDEDRRKDILRNVEQMKFVESVYESDKYVFYCWNAFEGQSVQNPTENVLKCLLRLDQKGVKGQRFVKYETRLFLLCGQSMVTTENCKQKKSVEVGQEVVIPPHTRYQLEARGIESSYFYVIISHRNSF